MKLLGLTIQRAPAAVRIVRGGELMSDARLDEVFAVTETHPMFQAILQLLETAEENANINAAADPTNRENYVGGAAQLRLVLADIALRQARGKEARKRRGGRPLIMTPRVEPRIAHRTIGSEEEDD